MRITFYGMDESIDEATRKNAEKKLNKLGKFFKKECDAKITMKKERGRCRAEVSFEYDGIVFRAEETANTFNAAIGSACSSIERQIRKRKTKLNKQIHEQIEFPETATVANGEEEDIEIIRRKVYDLKPVTAEEAVLQMDMMQHDFYMFIDADTGHTAVAYRRKGGGYGIIESSK